MSVSPRLICLHGFLGQPSDWDFLSEDLKQAELSYDLIDLGREGSRAVRLEQDWEGLIRDFCGGITTRSILLGYSMGGRFAMRALMERPEIFCGAILVAAHPGMSEESAKGARRSADEAWARRFEAQDWNAVVESWNSQEVFRGSQPMTPRLEQKFSRASLSWQLRQGSLGWQRDFSREIGDLSVPLLWVSGENDTKHRKLTEELRPRLGARAPAEVWVTPGAGHRVPWDQPELFKAKLLDWIFEQVLGKRSQVSIK